MGLKPHGESRWNPRHQATQECLYPIEGKEIEMWIEGNDLHFKYGFITKTMKIAPLWEDGVWWDFEYAKQQHEEEPEIVDSMVGCLTPRP